jgi:hypothetical protein
MLNPIKMQNVTSLRETMLLDANAAMLFGSLLNESQAFICLTIVVRGSPYSDFFHLHPG